MTSGNLDVPSDDDDQAVPRDDLTRLVAALPLAIVEFGPDGCVRRANRRAVQLLALPLPKLEGLSAQIVLAGAYTIDGMALRAATCPVTRTLAGEGVGDLELVLRHGGGRYERTVQASAAVLPGPDGRPGGAVLTLVNVPDSSRVRADLTRSRQRMGFALEAARMVAWDWNPKTGHVSHSDDVNQITPTGQVETRTDFQALIHPDDRERVRKTFAAAFTSGENYHCEYRLSDPTGGERWVVSRGRVIDIDGERWMSGVMSDITERRAAEEARLRALVAMRDSEERLRLAVEGTGIGIYDVEIETGEAIWSPVTFGMLGLAAPADNRSTFDEWLKLLHPDDVPAVTQAHNQALAAVGPLDIDYRIHRADTGEERWLSVFGRIYHTHEARTRSVGVVLDITDKKRTEERERLLMREVDHRAKNVLAVVQSILHLMPRQSPEDFFERVTGRIGAVARAHTLLADARWSAASLRRMLDEEAAPFAGTGRVEIAGRDILLQPEAAQPVAMVLHELMTNAAKYGALANGSGRLKIAIADKGGLIELVWRESVPHAVTAPHRPGFGTRLMRQIVEKQLGGTLDQDWRETGLTVTLRFAGAAAARPTLPATTTEVAREATPTSFEGRSVLVVEDDALIAMTLEDAVEMMNGQMVAQNSIEAALAWLKTETPAYALLDVNLHGQMVTPVAEELTRRRVPIVYATGYSDVLADLPGAPIVRKPYAPEKALALLLAQNATTH